ncbi:MAG: HAD hydrolase-like protein [Bacteroidales bacterium]
MSNYKEKLKHITTFIFDFDGVLSDGKVWVVDAETQLRNSNVKDGYAIHHAVKNGYNVAVISGGKGQTMEERLKFIGVSDIFTQVHYKKEKFEAYLLEKNLKAEEVLYMGDDIPDYEVMQMAGMSACPADAATEILDIAQYISHKNGGDGCVRDIIEQVLRARNDWFNEQRFHW